jgi:pimeloyl-ACP methyl ester carboxylesterase
MNALRAKRIGLASRCLCGEILPSIDPSVTSGAIGLTLLRKSGGCPLQRATIAIAGVDLELFECGDGPPILFLHGGDEGFVPEHPYVAPLSARNRLIAPSHPGFGRSSLPDWIDAVDDIAHIHLELIDRLSLGQVDIVGCQFGGWIAAELATKTPGIVRRLVLSSPSGVKLGPIDRLEFPDIFALPQSTLEALVFHDPQRMRQDPSRLSDEQLSIILRNRESLTLLSWEPYMHNPKLRHRLHRITAPTLLLRGESDGLVSADYLAGYAKLLPNARMATIAAAGHLPQMEQPEAFAANVLSFFNAGAVV